MSMSTSLGWASGVTRKPAGTGRIPPSGDNTDRDSREDKPLTGNNLMNQLLTVLRKVQYYTVNIIIIMKLTL